MKEYQKQVERQLLSSIGVSGSASEALNPPECGFEFVNFSDSDRFSFLAQLSSNFRHLSTKGQTFFVRFLTLHTESSERKDFLSQNRLFLSDSVAKFIENGRTGPKESLEQVDTARKIVQIQDRDGGDVILGQIFSRIALHAKHSNSIPYLSKASDLPLEDRPEIKRRLLEQFQKSGLVSDFVKHKSATSFLLASPVAASHYIPDTPGVLVCPPSANALSNSARNSNYYVRQAVGLLLISQDDGREFLYSAMDKVLWDLSDPRSLTLHTSTATLDPAHAHKVGSALRERGFIDIFVNDPSFESTMLQDEVVQSNFSNMCCHLAHNPYFETLEGSDQRISTKDLIKDIEASLRFLVYDSLMSPCEDYRSLHAFIAGYYDQVSDPIVADLFASTVTRVVMTSPSHPLKLSFLENPYLTPSCVKILLDSLRTESDPAISFACGGFILNSISKDPVLMKPVEAAGVAACNDVCSDQLREALFASISNLDKSSVDSLAAAHPRVAEILAGTTKRKTESKGPAKLKQEQFSFK